ncbi:glycosyltransferase [Rubrivirga sp. S365]|uniref:glycosyltransferase n=1 Tax=Rubrivirga sp. S365 TaxID=3076080 RepID=UPI0028C6C446|nr:glycosyltransferase [Rubrivirga sp. S365]MDT7858013.1 glycosyltransferase [Rubrivirga sp. S365]
MTTPSPRPIGRVCVQWPRLGPYHLARLRALHARLGAEGVALTALETATVDTTYAWREEAGPTPYDRVCALPGRSMAATPPVQTRRAVTSALDRIDADAVAITSYSTPDAHAALAWCRRRSRVAVLLFDSRAEDAERSPWRERVKRTLVAQYDAALVAGTPQAAYAVALGVPRRRVFTPLDVVDNAFFRDGAARERGRGGVGFLSVNRFTERKNVGLLVEAYRRYRAAAEAPWPLVLVGDGPLRPALERAAGEGVTFAGFAQIEALPAHYGAAGAYVHPARADQWGLVVNEAMASGLPVLVSSGAGCARDLVREGENGFRFAPDDPGALADLLAHVASDRTDRDAMGQASQSIIASYTPEAFADGLWNAVRAGRPGSGRPLSPAARAVLGALAVAGRDHHAFHSVEA